MVIGNFYELMIKIADAVRRITYMNEIRVEFYTGGLRVIVVKLSEDMIDIIIYNVGDFNAKI